MRCGWLTIACDASTGVPMSDPRKLSPEELEAIARDVRDGIPLVRGAVALLDHIAVLESERDCWENEASQASEIAGELRDRLAALESEPRIVEVPAGEVREGDELCVAIASVCWERVAGVSCSRGRATGEPRVYWYFDESDVAFYSAYASRTLLVRRVHRDTETDS